MTSLRPEKVTDLIDKLLKEKDPATVGLRRILKQKQDIGKDYPLHSAQLKEFKVPGKKESLFDDDQRRVIELEKELITLRARIDNDRRNSESAVKKAFEDGRKKGEAEGLLKGEAAAKVAADAAVAAIQAQVGDYLTTFENSKKLVYANAEHLLLKFCMQVAAKVLCTEVTQNSDAVLAVIKKSLSYIANREKLIIRVSPADFDNVSGRKDFWAPVAERLTDILIEPDDRIEQGGCIIDSNSGIVDARLGVQLSEIAELIEKVWGSNNPAVTTPAADTSAAS